jgi:DNA gyrase subunit A
VEQKLPARGVVVRAIEEEMKKSYIDYAMSVIVGRALPDVRDGLKPVQRRILYAMSGMGVGSGAQHRKCARIVGEVLGKYHPHGDQAVYDALVRMAQDFSMKAPLIDGQGNFGSIDGDSPAAMRYTECRLSKIAEEVLQDSDKETVDFTDNFDGTLKEPVVLPGKFPNLLVNGASGIAVGMATNIPPHNLGEVVDALVYLIDNPEAEIYDLYDPDNGPIRGPDFPTGGTVYGRQGVDRAYLEGRGLVRLRATAKIEEAGRDKKRIVVTEIPYMVNKTTLIESIANLIKTKRLDGATDLRDESDREGMRIVVELRRDAVEDVVLNQLYAHTQMETTFGVINLALVDGAPRVLNLKETLQEYVRYREDVIRRRTAFDLRKAQERSHIVEGLITAIDHIDAIIQLIRRARDVEEAREALMTRHLLSEKQARAILEMSLRKLTGLEIQKLRDEHVELKKTIDELQTILASEPRVLEIIKEELLELKDRYADARQTAIEPHAEDLAIEDLIPERKVVVTITNTGYIKRLPLATYRQQRRGGVGLRGMGTKEEDYVVDLFVTSTHNYLLFFTNRGRVHWLKAYRIPTGGRHARGKPVINLLPRLEKGERIAATIPVDAFDETRYLLFATSRGLIKKTSLKAYSHPRVTGIWAIKLRPGDELVEVRLTDGTKDVILATRQGKAVRFREEEVRPIGRYTSGVKGVRLRKDDAVVGMAIVDANAVLLTVTERGYGKRSRVADYRRTRRGAQGVITIRTTPRNGPVVAVRQVDDGDELLLTSERGMVIRIPVRDVRVMGRATQGVRIMRLREGDKVNALARLVTEQEEEVAVERAADAENGTPTDETAPA